ncbi:MAG: hypothetical protein CR997_07625 [Acidobacteria bacterium]|nr:MAG: hypothetical protein CR997_07625 [Acidobacteriota bacterium]
MTEKEKSLLNQHSENRQISERQLEVLHRAFDVQLSENAINDKEVELKKDQLEVYAREVDHSAEYSKLALQAAIDNNREEREQKIRLSRIYLVCGLIGFGLFALFILSLLYIGNEGFAKFITEKIGYVVIAVVSYLVGKKARKKPEHDEQED